MKTASIRSSYIIQHNYKLEGEHYLNDNAYLSMQITMHTDKCIALSQCASVFNPPVFKRQFCTKTSNSVQYFQSSDVTNSSEQSPVYVNKNQASHLNLLVHAGDILITGFGCIGDTRLVTKHQNCVCYANNVCRVRANADIMHGYLYAFLSSKYAHAQINNNASGSVVRYIEAPGIKKTLVPNISIGIQKEINDLILEATRLREEATDLLYSAQEKLKSYAGLKELTPNNYDYYGSVNKDRKPSVFVLNRKDISAITINAFNYSERIRKTKELITKHIPLAEVLVGEESFSTGSFPRIEVKPGNGVKLINQSDIFDTKIKGKYISRKNLKLNNLVQYGEILIAGVGTLGENETFCRTVFANEDLVGQLVSGEFIRMKTKETFPSGYLYAWLSSDYGFRLLRNTQTGTKLCRPIPSLLLKIPVPIIETENMEEIDSLVRKAHTFKHIANKIEDKAISLIEREIEGW